MCCYWVRFFSFHSFIVLAFFVRKPQPSEYQACKIHGYMRCVLNVHRKDVNHLCIEKRTKYQTESCLGWVHSLLIQYACQWFLVVVLFSLFLDGDEEARLQLYANIMTDESGRLCVSMALYYVIFTHVYSLLCSLALVRHFFAPSMR